MFLRNCAASLLAVTLPCAAVFAQATMPIQMGMGAKPVSQTPPADPDDSPDDIAKDAARDLNPNRFYNKPGATRAQYDVAWQDCRLIARGSRTPSGTLYLNYNPATTSPMAAGMGGALGGLIAGAIIQGEQRRANRRGCMLMRGWRTVEPAQADVIRVTAMGEAQREAWLDDMIGAPKVDGKITERTSFVQMTDPAMNLDAPVSALGTLYVGKKVDPAVPIKLEAGEAVIVLAFRRPDAATAGRAGSVQFSRYDAAARDLVYQPSDWKKKGDKTTYLVSANSADRKAPFEVQLLRVTAGDYVLSAMGVGPIAALPGAYCFGSPTFHVGEGEVVYVGDFIPYWGVRLATGAKISQLSYASHFEDSRKVVESSQPDLAQRMRPAAVRNKATYGCSAVTMDRLDLAGAGAVDDPQPPAAALNVDAAVRDVAGSDGAAHPR